MQRLRALGASGLQVSPLCLGGNVFGWSADEDASFAVLDAFADAGGNFIDTANIYSGWIPGNQGGESEAIIGRWLAGRPDRDRFVVATKVGMAGGRFPKGLTRDHIRAGIDGSLERLGLDRVPLYFAHEDDPATPLAETMAAFDELVREGLVGAVGASNYDAVRLAEALHASEAGGLVAFTVVQPHYNLVDRSGYEGALEHLCLRRGLGVVTYFALARGFLTGKYRRDQPLPESARAGGIQKRYLNETGFAAVDKLEEIGRAHEATIAQTAIAWVLANPAVDSAIIGANSIEQLEDTAKGAAVRLSAEEKTALDEVTAWEENG